MRNRGAAGFPLGPLAGLAWLRAAPIFPVETGGCKPVPSMAGSLLVSGTKMLLPLFKGVLFKQSVRMVSFRMTQAHRRKKQPELVRQQLVEAAARLVVEKGVQAVTLDAVAKRALVSKGGLQHHFPNKQALLEAVFATLQERFAADIAEEIAKDPEPRGQAARAYVRVTTRGFGPGENKELWQALNLALMAEPSLREPWCAWMDAAAAPDLAEGEDRVGLLICRLAADGLWMADLLGDHTIEPSLRAQVLQRLERMTLGQAP